jgi:hypothetical protein
MALPIMDNLGVVFKSKEERAAFFADRIKNHATLQSEINIPFRVDYSAFTKTVQDRVEHANEIIKYKQQRAKKTTSRI